MTLADQVRALERFMDCPDVGETEQVAEAVGQIEKENKILRTYTSKSVLRRLVELGAIRRNDGK